MSKTAPFTPRVSVIIATFNWSSALRCALRAMRLQTFSGFEVLVVGDGCTDDSEKVVGEFTDARFRWINLERNHGNQWAPNNRGIELAQSEWIAYCGHDDIWHPDHLSHMLAAAENSSSHAAVGGMIMYGPNGSGVVSVAGFSPTGKMGSRDFVPPSALMHRRDLIDRIGPWRSPECEALPVDSEFQMRISHATPIATSNELTVFKFNAASRRDSYRHKDVSEQVAMLQKIESGKEFRHQELAVAVQAFSRGCLHAARHQDVGAIKPGVIASSNRKLKGVEAPFAQGQLVVADCPWRFGSNVLDGAYEWYEMETASDGQTFRWSGPLRRSVIDLTVALDRPLLVMITIVTAVTPWLLESLRVFVNDSPSEFKLDREGCGAIISLAVDPEPERNLRITLEIERTISPYDLGLSLDMRRLGIALSHIDVAPRE